MILKVFGKEAKICIFILMGLFWLFSSVYLRLECFLFQHNFTISHDVRNGFFPLCFASFAYRQFVNAHMCRNETKLEEEDWWERYFNIIIRMEKIWCMYEMFCRSLSLLSLSLVLSLFRLRHNFFVLRRSCSHGNLGKIYSEIQKPIEPLTKTEVSSEKCPNIQIFLPNNERVIGQFLKASNSIRFPRTHS